jgi:thioredoxin reductase
MASDAFEAASVVIVGAGPAGLSAALVLGRCRERVLVLDDGQPRNQRSRRAHGFFTRDGAPPDFLREQAIEQLSPYDVRVETAHVSAVRCTQQGFELSSEHRSWFGRKLLLATGMREEDAQIPGVVDHLGCGVYCCPYCDGWELRDRSLGGLATTAGAAEFALALLTWSERVTLFTHGVARLAEGERAQLAAHGVKVLEQPIERVVGRAEAGLQGVQLRDGPLIQVNALFLHAGQHQHSRLAQSIGCKTADADTIATRGHQHTNVPGLYVAGDAAAHVNSIALAVADGYRAAIAIHTELRKERQARR